MDDVRKVREILDDLAVASYYIHADAALSGMILPFVDEPQPYGFDAGFDSVSISGHKMIGSPLPCGIALTWGEYVARIARSIEYVGVLDTTLAGSRNAITPLIIWYALQQHGLDGFRKIIAECLAVAEYARGPLQRLRHLGVAEPELGHGGISKASRRRDTQVATRALRGHRTSDYNAPSDS